MILFLYSLSPLAYGVTVGLTGGGSVNAGSQFENSGPGPASGSLEINSSINPDASFSNYTAGASWSAGYGVVGSSAFFTFDGFNTRFQDPNLIASDASAGFADNLTVDSSGLSGQSGTGEITISLSGNYSGSGSSGITTSGGGRFEVTVNGVYAAVNGYDTNRTETVTFPLVFGEPISLEGSLGVDVIARAAADTYGASGLASAAFANTAGITDLQVFDSAMSPVDYSLASDSGAFQFYTPVPELRTTLLCVFGFAALINRRTRRR